MYMYIERTPYGWRIRTEDTPEIHYIGYTARQAEQKHRSDHGLHGKHFAKIYL